MKVLNGPKTVLNWFVLNAGVLNPALPTARASIFSSREPKLRPQLWWITNAADFAGRVLKSGVHAHLPDCTAVSSR